MKKAIVLLMVFISFSLFALDSASETLVITGYYEETESIIVFKVWKETGSTDSERVYHAGDIYIDSNPTSGEATVFNWELYGNKALTILLNFTITPLQAYSNGTYYIPKHNVKMTDGVTTQTHSFATASTGSSSYPGYRQGNSGAASFIINSAEFSFTESVSDVITKSGSCSLQVLEYDDQTAGNFDYVSYVTVEFNTI
ncbi:MAG: hypothetical protein IKP61_09695 [Spirochaetales bacterium]|nr:hypothetical protein [Spirochaetales bacterium]